MTFSFYKARPLRRQKYSPLRTAENSCWLNPLRRKNAPPPPLGAARQPQKLFCKPSPAAEIFSASHGGKLMSTSPRFGGKTHRRPHPARLDRCKSCFRKPASHEKKSRRQALTFSFYIARPLRRQKYSPLRMAENSCRLNPLRRQNAPPPPTRHGSTAAKAAFASPLRTKKSRRKALTFSFLYSPPAPAAEIFFASHGGKLVQA